MRVTESQPFTYNTHKADFAGNEYGGEEGKMATDKFEHATFYLTREQVNNIKELARENQISRSALVRMIIREYLARQDEDREK